MHCTASIVLHILPHDSTHHSSHVCVCRKLPDGDGCERVRRLISKRPTEEVRQDSPDALPHRGERVLLERPDREVGVRLRTRVSWLLLVEGRFGPLIPWDFGAFAVLICVCVRLLSFAESSPRAFAVSSPPRLCVLAGLFMVHLWRTPFSVPTCVGPMSVVQFATRLGPMLSPGLDLCQISYELTHIPIAREQTLNS